MRSIFRYATVLGVVLLVVAGIGSAVGVASAQEVANATNASTSTPEVRETSMELSPVLTLEKWEYRKGTWRLTVRSEVPTRMTLTDAAAIGRILTEGDGPAAGTARTKTVNVGSGRSVVTMEGVKYGGMAAVTVAPQRADRIAVLRTDAMDPPASYIKQGTAGFLVLVAVIGTGVGTYRRVVARLEDEEQEVERIL